MDVSIIIVNYNTSQLIVNCVKSILLLTKDITYEVIIVDNNSEVNFENIILSGIEITDKKNFHFIPLPENIGFGRANNEGLKIAKGRNIFFLNPDTILLNNAVKILSDFLDHNPKAGACGGNLVNTDFLAAFSYRKILPGIFWNINEILNNIPEKIIFGSTNYYYNQKDKICKVGFINGADLMVKKEILDITGSFSPEFFMYYEETDLCTRIRRKGLHIYSVPQAKIQHLESKSFSSSGEWQSELKTRMFEESRAIYYKRNIKSVPLRICNCLYLILLNSRILLIPNPSKKEYYKLRKQLFQGK